jgi:DNA-binding protein YbaB
MTAEMHPQVAEALAQAQQFQSILDDHAHRTDTDTVKATDDAESVEVTLDRHRWLADLKIEAGLLRLGAETVEERINDALRKAVDAATATNEAEDEQLVASLAAITGSLNDILGLA